jgi:hypothetical protein
MNEVQILRFAIRIPDTNLSNGTTNCQVSVPRAGTFAKRDERDNRLFRQEAGPSAVTSSAPFALPGLRFSTLFLTSDKH